MELPPGEPIEVHSVTPLSPCLGPNPITDPIAQDSRPTPALIVFNDGTREVVCTGGSAGKCVLKGSGSTACPLLHR